MNSRRVPNREGQHGELVTYKILLTCPVGDHEVGRIIAEHDRVLFGPTLTRGVAYVLDGLMRSASDGDVAYELDDPRLTQVLVRCGICHLGPFVVTWPTVTARLADMRRTGTMTARLRVSQAPGW